MSSVVYNNAALKGQERILSICQMEKASTYINLIGGKTLYNKKIFGDNGLDLFFLESKLPEYKQFNKDFVPGLSIIDVMMFNDKITIRKMLNNYLLS